MNLSDLNNLDFNNAGSWPMPLKVIAMLFVIAIVGAAGFWFDTKDLIADLESSQAQEGTLKREFEEKQRVVANVEVYRERLVELTKLLGTAVGQLPTGTEMPNLLESISDTGKVNGLAFELFKPESEQPREEFLAAVPISIKARGTYHQFGAFISSVAAMDRIVTLERAVMVDPGKDRNSSSDEDEDKLEIQATLQTYRYLEDTDEPTAGVN